MLIHELCARCRVTKKAVAYAIEQGLLTPTTAPNGYRTFTEADACTMGRIATLRALGLTTADIRAALDGPDWSSLCRASAVNAALAQEKHRILSTLAANGDWQAARQALDRLAVCSPITERLRVAFPGPFGDFLAAHFAPYLSGPIENAAQQSAWEEAIAWLDNTAFAIPADLAEHFHTSLAAMDTPAASEALAARMEEALRDQQAYLAAHAEEIRRYQVLKASPEYQKSPAGRMESLLRDFLAQSGYNDVFIPALRRLSPEYEAYQRRLQSANAAFSAAISEKT